MPMLTTFIFNPSVHRRPVRKDQIWSSLKEIRQQGVGNDGNGKEKCWSEPRAWPGYQNGVLERATLGLVHTPITPTPTARMVQGQCSRWLLSFVVQSGGGDVGVIARAVWAILAEHQEGLPQSMYRPRLVPKNFQDFPSHQMFRNMHEALNVHEKQN
jgi:hypothetical protein